MIFQRIAAAAQVLFAAGFGASWRVCLDLRCMSHLSENWCYACFGVLRLIRDVWFCE